MEVNFIEIRNEKDYPKNFLFIDNCAAHNYISNFSNVMIEPANITSKLQPLDQGIVDNFKAP